MVPLDVLVISSDLLLGGRSHKVDRDDWREQAQFALLGSKYLLVKAKAEPWQVVVDADELEASHGIYQRP